MSDLKQLPLEIERKFLVKEAPSLIIKAVTNITQGYLATGTEELRLRQANSKYYLTLKRGCGIQREEHEFEIAPETFSALAKGVEFLSKQRISYALPDGYTADLDVYFGLQTKLMTVEVEFPTMDAAVRFIPPDWFGAEVTGDKTYSNAALIATKRKGDSLGTR